MGLFDNDDDEEDYTEDDKKYEKLLESIEKMREKHLAQVALMFYKKPKEEIKVEFEDWETERLEDVWKNYFIGMEEYEMCAALKEVIDERYTNPAKRKAYGDLIVKEEMDSIKFQQEIVHKLGNEMDWEWDQLKEAIDKDEAVKESFFTQYPTRDMIKLEFERFTKRNRLGKMKDVDIELLGYKDIHKGFVGKFNGVYDKAELKISIDSNKIILTFRDENNVPWILEYTDFELTRDEMQ